MPRTVGYMITWTTYGTWLQGEKQGFVKDGIVRGRNAALKTDCQKKLKRQPVRLENNQKAIVRQAVAEAAKRFGQKIYAIAVCSNHVHIACEYVQVPISVLVGYYKNAARKALQKSGYEGRVWTKGYDKRFCFNQKAMTERIKYVKEHDFRTHPKV
ncbi:MAG TPA: transposase [Sedimentisphaerales bacterium]|nr:transposase [Sedimentisphaerales bacterium]